MSAGVGGEAKAWLVVQPLMTHHIGVQSVQSVLCAGINYVETAPLLH